MLLELRARSQITLPKNIIEKFGLATGDKLEVIEKDDAICLIPVAVYPKSYVQNLEAMFVALDEGTLENLRRAEALRATGETGSSVEEFAEHMRQAIARGANEGANS